MICTFLFRHRRHMGPSTSSAATVLAASSLQTGSGSSASVLNISHPQLPTSPLVTFHQGKYTLRNKLIRFVVKVIIFLGPSVDLTGSITISNPPPSFPIDLRHSLINSL